ncbi:MAG: hypothetical protein AB8B93_12075, partial [Pseudomonadales bacterium]
RVLAQYRSAAVGEFRLSGAVRADHEMRAIVAQSVICALAALAVLVWVALVQGESGWWQMAASGLGSIAIVAPSALFAWRSRRLLSDVRVVHGVRTSVSADAEGQQQRAQQMMGLAGLKLVATMILMVIAYVLAGPQAQWVLVGIAAAAIGAVIAAWIVSSKFSK